MGDEILASRNQFNFVPVGLTMAEADEVFYLLNYQKKWNARNSDKMRFTITDALIAVSKTVTGGNANLHERALHFLSHHCGACEDYYPPHEMANLACHDNRDGKECCITCALGCFKSVIEGEVINISLYLVRLTLDLRPASFYIGIN